MEGHPRETYNGIQMILNLHFLYQSQFVYIGFHKGAKIYSPHSAPNCLTAALRNFIIQHFYFSLSIGVESESLYERQCTDKYRRNDIDKPANKSPIVANKVLVENITTQRQW